MAIDFATIWNFGDPATSEQRFVNLLDTLNDPLDQAETVTQIARAQGLQRRFDEARITLRRTESLMGVAQTRATVRWLLETGRVENSSGQSAAAVPWFERAWLLACQLGEDALAVDAAHMLGIVLPDELAAEWNHRALALALRSSDPAARRWTASLRNNMGWWLHDRGRFDEALAMFEQARVDREQQGVRGPLLIARWAVARCLRSLGQMQKALHEQQLLLGEHDRDGRGDGYVHEELAECLMALGRQEEARHHFQRTLDLLAPTGESANIAPERLSRWRALSQ